MKVANFEQYHNNQMLKYATCYLWHKCRFNSNFDIIVIHDLTWCSRNNVQHFTPQACVFLPLIQSYYNQQMFINCVNFSTALTQLVKWKFGISLKKICG